MAFTQLKLALIGPSGSGKSTSAQLLKSYFSQQGLKCGIYKLAKPLYDLQQHIYEAACRSIMYTQQNQLLLELIAEQMREISSTSLVDNLMQRLADSDDDVVINDDLRDDVTDWPCLVKANFRILRIHTQPKIRLQRLAQRSDLKIAPTTKLDDQISRIRADYVIVNNSELSNLSYQLHALADQLLETLQI